MRKFVMAVLVLLIPASAFAEDKFIRTFKNTAGDTAALETATVRYEKTINNYPVIVDVHGAVHLADKAYYIRKNIEFESYDTVLYELVADETGQRPNKNGQDMYAMFSNFIELESQLGVIDYQAKNFVHADLTKKELTKKMRANGDDMTTLFLEFLLNAIRQQNKTAFALEDAVSEGRITVEQSRKRSQPQINLMQLLIDPNRAVKIKRMMADAMAETDVAASFGPVIGGYLIAERNKKCIAALEIEFEVLRAHPRYINGLGFPGPKFAIFYGAAHMPDLEKRILALGFKRTKIKWTQAWDLFYEDADYKDPLLELLRQLQKLE